MAGTGGISDVIPIRCAIWLTAKGEKRFIRYADIQLIECASAHFSVTISPSFSLVEFLGSVSSIGQFDTDGNIGHIGAG